MEIVQLAPHHKRDSFRCKHNSLTGYIQRHAGHDIRRALSRCYVISDGENNVVGYYTLSNSSISKENAPEKWMKLPYLRIQVTLPARLAVSTEHENKGIGKALIRNALIRSYNLAMQVGSSAVVVDPIDDDAVNFYAKFGFEPMDSGMMILAMQTIHKAFKDG